MALSTCPEDVLFNIASYLHSNGSPDVYCNDLDDRVQIFGSLIRVCRRFYEVFIRMLYRTLCYTYEPNTWPKEHEALWLQQNPQRRSMSALYRTLRAVPALGSYTQCLEVRWEEYDNTLGMVLLLGLIQPMLTMPENNKYLSRFLGMFSALRELEICASIVPYRDDRRWALDFMRTDSFKYLRRLRINQPFNADMLPNVFFLPYLDDLELVHFDTGDIHTWTLGHGAEPETSKVTHLSLSASLTPVHLLQILSWPLSLTTLIFINEGYRIPPPMNPSAEAFIAALQRFSLPLKTLNLRMSDDFFEFESANVHGACPYLDTRQFNNLEELRIPSTLLTGPRGENYDRENIPAHLPSSLRTLEVVFGPRDLFLFRGWHRWANRGGHAYPHQFNWLLSIGRETDSWGRFPVLDSVIVREEGLTYGWRVPHELQQVFSMLPFDPRRLVELKVQLSVPQEVEYEHDDIRYDQYTGRLGTWDPEEWLQEHLDGLWDGDPVFGDEWTVYPDSPHGSEEDEDAREYELMDDEAWEQFDERMAAERERRGEEWRRGQWPPYEETREERDVIWRTGVNGRAVDLPRW